MHAFRAFNHANVHLLFQPTKIAGRLKAEGINVSPKHASKLMKEMGLGYKVSRLRTHDPTNRKGHHVFMGKCLNPDTRQ